MHSNQEFDRVELRTIELGTQIGQESPLRRSIWWLSICGGAARTQATGIAGSPARRIRRFEKLLKVWLW